MDANVLEQAEVLAKSIAGQATTMEELNGVMKTLMKSALGQMLGAELKVHLKEESQAISEAILEEATPLRRGRNRLNGTSPGLDAQTSPGGEMCQQSAWGNHLTWALLLPTDAAIRKSFF